MTQLELSDITKQFGSADGTITAVDDLSFTINDGEFLVLLGPSGCGKTTTLRMIGGLEEPSAGDVIFDDIRVNDVKARNRDIAMVFQDFALYPHMTVEQNLGFGLQRENNNFSKNEVTERVHEVAEMLEIVELLGKKPAALSGGQKQRVALGRAIVREPRIFLFDEPLANLDAQLRKTMRTEIDELQSQMGVTAVYVTHNQEEAMTIADKIAVLNGGELQQLGPPTEVFNKPTNLFVAQFVGSPNMNLLDATIEKEHDAYRVTLSENAFNIPLDLLPGEIDTTDVVVGFRPQDLFRHVSDVRPRNHVGPVIDTDIRVVEPLGTDAVVHVASPEGNLTATMTQFHEIAEGNAVQFAVAPEHAYLFDRETGHLIKGRLDVERDESVATGRASS